MRPFQKVFKQSFNTQNTNMKLDKAKRNTRITHFTISSRGPRIWNSVTNNPTKTIDFHRLFKSTIKENLLKLKAETNYFNAAFFNIPVFLSFSFAFALENNFFS